MNQRASSQAGKRTLAHELSIVIALVTAAGWIDAVGFLRWHGVFVSFMSGNTTQGAVALGEGDWQRSADLFAVVLFFLAGVICGELLRAWWWQPTARSAVVGAVILLLALCWTLFALRQDRLALPLLAVSMGAQNASFRTIGNRVVALTYVTGTIVALGRDIAAVLRGQRARLGVLSDLLQWLGMVAGASGATIASRTMSKLIFAVPLTLLFLVIFSTAVIERRTASAAS